MFKKDEEKIMARGFSLLELLIVITIIFILSGISLFFLSSHQRLYKPDEQTTRIVDLLQEARQRSLTQRKTMRVEIDLTDNMVRLINEKESNTDADDEKIREAVLIPAGEVNLRVRPPDITANPPETLPVPLAQFKQSDYPTSALNDVCTIRFRSDGTVVDDDGVTTGLTLFVWSPKQSSTTESEIARAITIVGATGSVRLWEYHRDSRDANKWKDSRRSGVFGGYTSNSNTANP
jgi:prepilin-type N-terminal cleavage/methylation domain-containing protein